MVLFWLFCLRLGDGLTTEVCPLTHKTPAGYKTFSSDPFDIVIINLIWHHTMMVYHQNLNEHSKQTSIAHPNIHAKISTFNKFVMMLQEYQFYIIALSETWLHDCSFQENHVQINGCNSAFRNRIGKRGGSDGFYVKESVTNKVRHGNAIFRNWWKKQKYTFTYLCCVNSVYCSYSAYKFHTKI